MYASSYPIWIHIHWAFVLLFLFAFAAGIVWLVRFASRDVLKNTLWVSLVAGLLGMLLTTSAAYQGMGYMMKNMMRSWDEEDGHQNSDDSQSTQDSDRYESMEERMDEMMDLSNQDEQ